MATQDHVCYKGSLSITCSLKVDRNGKQEMSENTWRNNVPKDNTFVEGLKKSGEHLHYDKSGGSDVPVNWRNEKTGEGVNLRSTPLQDLRNRGLLK